ncbi:MAG: hypothetical protein AB8F94_02555 [Saprospiraceae bacterium]
MKVTNQNINIFIAYSRKDIKYLEQLAIHLKPLERKSNIEIWYDGKIEAGSIWEEEIKKHLHGADQLLPCFINYAHPIIQNKTVCINLNSNIEQMVMNFA